MKQSSNNSPSPTRDEIAKQKRANAAYSLNTTNPVGQNNVELTYYTLSGKEVNIREEVQRPLSVNSVYMR